ncbi:RNA 2'-phosphotransferase [Dyella sp.]|uniref:RNA 2'-phosphotransferase n=1 Tax=Dyella sp. TaxID=1869338 RepID=UPI002ED1C423
MSNTDTLVKTSKFLSLVLRHAPESIGLSLDDQGWADIDSLTTCAAAHGMHLDRDLIDAVVAQNDKKRFALSQDGQLIRAVQGHSTASVNIDHVAKTAPDVLYHGTATRFLDSIRQQGLLPGKRHHVHLSADVQTAIRVGQRHGKPVVLTIDTARMQADGLAFFQADNGVWLTATVPTIYIYSTVTSPALE